MAELIQPRRVKHLKALTGLRFVAALAVFVHHTRGHFGLPKSVFPLGAAGVSFFFVLSGFILTYVYYDRLKTRAEIWRFYFTRWARIWPLHVVTLVLFLFVVQNSLGEEPWKVIGSALLVQSWIPNVEWVFAGNGVSWSISTEAFFYVMFPLLLLGGEKKFWWKYFALFIATIICIALLQLGYNYSPESKWPDYQFVPQFNPFIRLLEFATGIAVGHFYMRTEESPQRNWGKDTTLELFAISAMVGYYFLLITFVRAWQTPAVVKTALLFSSPCFCFGLMIYWFSQSKGLLSRLASNRVMVYLGEISFSFYMVHNIVLLVLRQRRWAPVEPDPNVFFWGAFLISLCAAGLLYAIVEIPFKDGLAKAYDSCLKKINKEKSGKRNKSLPIKWGFQVVALSIPLAAAVFYFDSQRLQNYPEPVARDIMQRTKLFQNEVHFGDEVILHGVVGDPEYDGLLLRMVWQKKKPVTAKRFIHVCDEDGKVVYLVKHQSHEAFDQQKVDAIWHDEFYLAPEMLENAAYIGIGFWDKESGGVKVDSGPRSLEKHRLNVYDLVEWSGSVAPVLSTHNAEKTSRDNAQNNPRW